MLGGKYIKMSFISHICNLTLLKVFFIFFAFFCCSCLSLQSMLICPATYTSMATSSICLLSTVVADMRGLTSVESFEAEMRPSLENRSVLGRIYFS